MKADKLHLYIVAGINSGNIKRCHLVLTQCVSLYMMERMSKLVTTRDGQKAVEIEISSSNYSYIMIYIFTFGKCVELCLCSLTVRVLTENRTLEAANMACK